MSHVDDGQLNALLDGELSGVDARAVEAHVAQCAGCRRRLEEARAFLKEAGSLLESLGPAAAAPAAVPVAPAAAAPAPPRASRPSVPIRPAAGLADTVPEGSLKAPAPKSGEPPRRIFKTAKEIAVEIDGRTALTPAIRPVFPDEVPPAAGSRRGLDVEKLAWAASIVLALGVGYLANESLHARRENIDLRARLFADSARGTLGRQVAAAPIAAPPAAEPAAPAASAERADRIPTRAHRGTSRRPSPALAARSERGSSKRPRVGNRRTDVASATGTLQKPPSATVKTPPAVTSPAGVAGGSAAELASRDAAPPLRQAPANAPTQGPATDNFALGRNAQGAGAAPAAPAPADARARSLAPSAPLSSAAPRAFADEPSGASAWRRVPMEEAVRTLSGAIRQIDGMRPQFIESSTGRLVSGADPGRDVVRVTYSDDAGRRFTLDQQRAEPREGRAFNGIIPGDTLVTITISGGSRVRWLDGKFWLSLTGPVPADELKRLLARVR